MIPIMIGWIIFILKITNVIDWPWVIVILPFIISPIVGFAVLSVMSIFIFFGWLFIWFIWSVGIFFLFFIDHIKFRISK